MSEPRILLVEDDPDDYVLARALLRDVEHGRYALDWAQTYADGLARLLGNAYDLCLLDLTIGADSGLDLLREATRAACTTPIVVMTGRADEVIERTALQAGAADYLVKRTLDRDAVARAIRHATERRRAHDALHARDRLVAAVFDCALDAFLIADDEGRYVDANPAACTMLGRDRATLLTMSVADIAGVGPADVMAKWQVFLDAGTMNGEFPLVRADGRTVWCAFNARAHVQPGRHLSVMRDITAQVEAREALRRSEALFASAFQLSPVAMALATLPEARLVDINEAATTLAGYTRSDMTGKLSLDLGLWPDGADRARLVDALAQGPVRDFATRLRRKDGAILDVLISMNQIEVAGEHRLLGVFVDVTDLKAATEKIAESERRLERSQQVASIGSWSCERDGTLRWSNQMYRLLGLPEDASITFEHYLAHVHPEDRDLVVRARAQGAEYDHEYRILRADTGELRWVHARVEVERDAAGECVRHLGTLQDITARRAAEAARRASDARYRRIVETAAEGIIMLDRDGRIEMTNRRVCELLGVDGDALVGTHIRTHVPERMHGELAAHLARRRTGATSLYDMAMVRADGSELIVQVSASPRLDDRGQYEGSLGMLTDVTERREVEHVRDRLAAIVQSANDAITSKAPDGTILSWNAGAERLFGFTRDEMIGTRRSDMIPPSHLDAMRAAFQRALAGEHVLLETERRHADGRQIDVVLTYSRMTDAAGRTIGVSSIARDVTDQRALERSLRATEDQLRQLQKMEAIGSLAGGIAHDFNNILCVILTCAAMIEEILGAGDPIRDDVTQIREAAERAGILTRQLLAFSRRQVLEPRVVKLDKVIGGLERMLKRVVGETIALEVSGDPEVGNVLVDPGQFEQVMMNLTVNARDAMPDGGTLSITTSNVELAPGQLPGARGGRYVRVSVSDAGMGMDRETRERMFEPFFTTKEKGRGTGLGLSTVFGIVQQSGGHIAVESEPCAGTTIDIYMPRTDAAEARPAMELTEVAPSRNETILLVEDDEAVRRSVQAALRRLGYKVLVAANAGEALLLAEQHALGVDLLLTDVVMPIMNGKQLAHRLAQVRPGLRTVFMSGYAMNVLDDSDTQSGGFVFVQKPIRPASLATKIREVLDGP